MLFALFCIIIASLATSTDSHGVLPGKFELAGRSGVPVMHAALLPTGKVVFLDKLENYTEVRLPSNRYAYSTIYDPENYRLHPLVLSSNPFCCGGAFLADGTLMTMGGNGPLKWLDSSIEDGFNALRYLSSQPNQEGWLEYPDVKMSSKRWYPSALTLSDGKIFVAAGSVNALNIRDPKNNNPTYELIDSRGKPVGESFRMEILVKNQPY